MISKLFVSNHSVRQKVATVMFTVLLVFFILVGVVFYTQINRVNYLSSREKIQDKSLLAASRIGDEIQHATEVLNVFSNTIVSHSSNVLPGDSTILRGMDSFNNDLADKILFVSTTSAAQEKKVFALSDGSKASLTNGLVAGGGINISDIKGDKKTSIVVSSADKKGYLAVVNKKSLADGSIAEFGVLISLDKILNSFSEAESTLKYILVNQSNDIMASNAAVEVGSSLSSAVKGFDRSISLASFVESNRYLKVNKEPYLAVVNNSLEEKLNAKLVLLLPKASVVSGAGAFMLILLAAILGLVVAYILINRMFKKFFTPIQKSIVALKEISTGQISEELKLEYELKDEIGEMTSSINVLIDNLNETARFAKEIGDGNLNGEFRPTSSSDKLGIALLGMQESLIKAKDIEETQKIASKKSHWANEGMANFSEILRNNHDNLKEMSFDVIKSLVNYVDAIQGGIFVLNDDTDERYLEMTACFAYNRRKMQQKRVELEEGLIGRCFFERQPILLKEMPNDYLEITSGLGHENPRNLLLVPLKLNEEVNGVIEIASFKEFEDYQIQFIEKIAESISSTITSVRINERTSALLERSQVQAEQMASQEEEMRQNLEELQATQEELEKRARENASITQALEKEKYLLDALLSSIPDFIYFKDEECRFIRVSESMAPLFKVKSGAELIGKSDFDFHSAEHAKKSYDEEMEIVRTGKKIINEVVRERWDDGREQWVSTTKMPLVASDGKIVGSFGISKVITDIKMLEMNLQQQNDEMKANLAKMEQANVDADNVKAMYTNIIDNLPLKVFVKDREGKLVVINSAVAHAHGLKTEELLGKSDFDFYDYDTAKKIYDSELEVIEGEEKSYVHEESFDGTTKILKTTKMPFYINTKQQKGLLGVQVDVSEFARIKENHES